MTNYMIFFYISTRSSVSLNGNGLEFAQKKLMVKTPCIEIVDIHWNCLEEPIQCVPTTYVAENKEENHLEIYIFQVSCPLSLPLLNIPNWQLVINPCHSIANCLYLHDSYISEFEFMNYLFAYLLVAWL